MERSVHADVVLSTLRGSHHPSHVARGDERAQRRHRRRSVHVVGPEVADVPRCTPIEDACGVFPPGAPRFRRFAGPRATAAVARDAKMAVATSIPIHFVRMAVLLSLRTGEHRVEYKGIIRRT